MQALGIIVDQQERHGLEHGVWMDETVRNAGEDDLFLFMDIDCITLNAEIVSDCFSYAEQGEVVGVAQAANHRPNPDRLYAGPPFLAFSRKTWVKLGSPSFGRDDEFDVAGRFSVIATEGGTPLRLLYPYFVGRPKWKLGTRNCLGIATFFDGGVFHLFESRRKASRQSFFYVTKCVIEKKPIDYLYLSQLARRRDLVEMLRDLRDAIQLKLYPP